VNGKVSREKAEELYGVVIDAVPLTVDEAATERKRRALRADAQGEPQA
jgi:hypothetical protein